MKIELDRDGKEQLVVASVLDSLSEKDRKRIIEVAAKSLLEPERSRGRSRRKQPRISPIQRVLNEAVKDHAEQMVRALVTSDEQLRAKIEEVVREGIARALETRREHMVSSIARTVTKAFGRRRDEEDDDEDLDEMLDDF